jgi:V8-like Glu-specific endopeptidase
MRAWTVVSASLIVAVSLLLASAPSIWPARADELQNAVQAVKGATDDTLRTEVQSRLDARQSVPRELDLKVQTRNVPSALSDYPNGVLLDAIHQNGRVIYGTDDRRDWYAIGDESVRPLARASVALFGPRDITPVDNNAAEVRTLPLGTVFHLCTKEKFREQVSGAFCSGTLVREDVVLTAGHCVHEISNNPNEADVNLVSFVFGYWIEKAGTSGPTVIAADHVYHGKEVIAGEMFQERDWALVRLEKAVPSSIASPVRAWHATPVEAGEKVFVLGFPSGIPLKYAPGAEIRDISKPEFFVANLDTFGGNSGSGVYDQTTKELLGVLVRGDTDYVPDQRNSCNRVNECPRSGCRGEDVTRITLVPTP